MLNKVVLIGRLTRDPELRHTQSQRAVCSFAIAVNRTFTQNNGEREADFINIVTWGRTAENVSKYMNKGSLVAVDGRIQTRNYENNQGVRVYVTEVVADNVTFLETRGQASNNNFDNDSNSINEEKNSFNTNEDPFAEFGNTLDISDDDLPF